jgi:hypothetical protein
MADLDQSAIEAVELGLLESIEAWREWGDEWGRKSAWSKVHPRRFAAGKIREVRSLLRDFRAGVYYVAPGPSPVNRDPDGAAT